MCTPGADEPVSTTSCRAAPPLPSIEIEALYRARKTIFDALPVNAVTRPDAELRLVLVVRFLIGSMNYTDPGARWSQLEHIADILGIDLPPRTSGGEAPR